MGGEGDKRFFCIIVIASGGGAEWKGINWTV